jgi:hypothetical protein
MKSEPFADALIQLVHCYYPSGLRNDEPRYNESEEGQRLLRLLHANASGSPTWKDFLQQVRGEFPDCSIWDTTVPLSDPCYSCRVSQPGFVTGGPRYDSVVFLLSQLTPVYALYGSELEMVSPTQRKGWFGFPPFPPDLQEREAKLVGLIESTLGFTRLSNELLFTPVPDLVPRSANYGLGEAQLIDCLFTWHRW